MTLSLHKSLSSAIKYLVFTALTVTTAACSSDSFKIKGEIEGADDKSVVLEKADYSGRWIAVDSTRTSGSGKFSISFAAPAAPEVFRLAYGGEYVYFPVDSTETITLTAPASAFARDFTLAGSEQAVDMMMFEKEAMNLRSVADSDSAARFKRKVFDLYIRERKGGLVSYYVLTKTIDGEPLFDPSDPADIKYYSAVATAFRQFKPEDPRTRLLEQTAINAMRKRNSDLGRRAVVEASELKVIDISLPGTDGTERTLSSVVNQGKPTVLAFTALDIQDAPAINRQLDALRKARGGNLNIYMVCLDADQHAWHEAASNLPWTVVFTPEGTATKALRDYNVSALPTFFLYSAAGELTDRFESVQALEKAL